jgi:murein DD-endopeptidase MepM/ murein hydrolase activator NlpD
MKEVPTLLRRRSKLDDNRRSCLTRAASACFLLLCLFLGSIPHLDAAEKPAAPAEDTAGRTRQLYERVGRSVGLPWHLVAAIDRYERTLSRARPKTRPLTVNALSGVYIPESRWAGELNPDPDDTNPVSIRFFGGIGRDGSGDGIADRRLDVDLLYTVASRVREYGSSHDDFGIGLWEYYQNTRAVQRVLQFAKLYEAFSKLDWSRHAFPVPIGSVYSYRSTWGTSRSWGGYRIHEGTDIFAGYGVPVRSTCYGMVELKGWNKYGGWRIGIRDLDNLYHYYAHLSGYNKTLKTGDLVRPGQVIGWVGSSGYGRPGTQGKFPPHLHYGVYRDRGMVEWAFDPYPMLRRWEAEERKALRVHRER